MTEKRTEKRFVVPVFLIVNADTKETALTRTIVALNDVHDGAVGPLCIGNLDEIAEDDQPSPTLLKAQADVLKYIEQTDRDYPIAVAVARAEAKVKSGELCVPLSDEEFAKRKRR